MACVNICPSLPVPGTWVASPRSRGWQCLAHPSPTQSLEQTPFSPSFWTRNP
uniref:Uncharacterized protein n=1 Tax=Arundo donax TaxID=35708 RepID=A0A0A9F8T3_ARUDO